MNYRFNVLFIFTIFSVFSSNFCIETTAQELFKKLNQARDYLNYQIEEEINHAKITLTGLEELLDLWRSNKGSLQQFPVIYFIKNPDLLEKIVAQKDIDFNKIFSWGNTEFPQFSALYLTLSRQSDRATEILLKANASPEKGIRLKHNLQDKPIITAYWLKNRGMMKLLAAYKADLSEVHDLAKTTYNRRSNWLNHFWGECKEAKEMVAFIEKLAREQKEK